MTEQKFNVQLKAQNRETGKLITFTGCLDNVGELLNNLIMSGCHNVTDVKIIDAEKETCKETYESPTINFEHAYKQSVAEGLC